MSGLWGFWLNLLNPKGPKPSAPHPKPSPCHSSSGAMQATSPTTKRACSRPCWASGLWTLIPGLGDAREENPILLGLLRPVTLQAGQAALGRVMRWVALSQAALDAWRSLPNDAGGRFDAVLGFRELFLLPGLGLILSGAIRCFSGFGPFCGFRTL